MTTPIDNWFARISKESLIRNPNTAGSLTWADISYDLTSTLNEKIDSLVISWGGNALIQFKDEGTNLGSTWTVSWIDFVWAWVTATRVGNDVTVTIPWGGWGATTLDWLTDVAIIAPTTGQALIYDGTQWENTTLPGGGDALTTNPLSQFASTTSAQLAGVISDETGSGWVLVFSNSPAITTPSIAAITVSGWTLTLPTGASDTLVRRNATETLTNKTLTSPVINTPTGIVKGDVGLGNVDNTSDSTKNSATATLTNKTLTTPVIASIKGTVQTDTDGATITFDKNVATYHRVVLWGNRTLAVSNMAAGDTMVIDLVQDGTWSRTVTWFTTIKWVWGTVPTLTTTINKIDTFGILCTSAGNYQAYILWQNI